MYVFDPSAIAILLKRTGEKAVKILKNQQTLDLARYELGNIIWKESVLRKTISTEEAISKAKHLAKLFKIMEIFKIETDMDFGETMKIASKLKLTFYDAAYLYVARKNKLKLVTEDKELKEKAEKINIKTLSVMEIIKES